MKYIFFPILIKDNFSDNQKQNSQSEATISSSNIQPVKWVKW